MRLSFLRITGFLPFSWKIRATEIRKLEQKSGLGCQASILEVMGAMRGLEQRRKVI
jgi:hypothetical protein